jgi:hypothetical protein
MQLSRISRPFTAQQPSLSKIAQRAWRLGSTISKGAHTKSGGSDAGSNGYAP